MYVTFKVEHERLGVARRLLKEFGLLLVPESLYEGPQYDRRWRYLQRLEFSNCHPRLAITLRQAMDSWGQTHKKYPDILEVVGTDCPEILEMLATPDPTKPSLTWAIRRFREYHPGQWQDYWTAVGRCGTASLDFLAFLEAKNVVTASQRKSGYAREVTEYFGDPRYATPDFPRECHCVVGVGRVRIDWTARQFGSRYEACGYDPVPIPLVWVNRTGQNEVFAPRR